MGSGDSTSACAVTKLGNSEDINYYGNHAVEPKLESLGSVVTATEPAMRIITIRDLRLIYVIWCRV